MPSNAIPSICTQRQQLAFLNKPANRLELVFPPSGFTTDQLNMRRKAEILKYNANKTNTKTNNLTKAQKWALLANNNNSQSLSQHFLSNASPTVPLCPYDISIATPTSSSDVPGPIMYLRYDASVPLYNYTDGQNTYGIINREDTSFWKTFSATDISFATAVDTHLMFVEFTSLVNPGNYHFAISTPVSIYVSGNGIGNPNSNLVRFSVSSISAAIYYSNQLVYTVPSSSILNNLQPVEFDTRYCSTNRFFVSQYVGILTINQIPLGIAPGFVYEIRATFTIGINEQNISSYIANLQTTAICNITSQNVNSSYGISSVFSQPSSTPITSQNFFSLDY
jgi:hypothetical protein